MMTELEKYLAAKQKAEQSRREADRLAGALSAAVGEMKRELHVNTLEEGEQLVERLKLKLSRAEAQRDKLVKEFNEMVEGKL